MFSPARVFPAALVAVFMFAGAAVPTAHAATISAPALHLAAVQQNDKTSAYWPTDPVKCDLILDGDVTDGDADTLQQKFSDIVGNQNSFSFFLCLRSNGGSVDEALKIAQFILATQRPSIATVVEDGQTCASACALIFLAGNAPAMKGAWPQRFLHPRGRLLFHSSRLDLSNLSNDALLGYLTAPATDGRDLKQRISDLYKDGLHDVQTTINTFQTEAYETEDLIGPWVPSSLFLEMFSQDPDEWVCIDDVDKVGRWNIQVFGYSTPKTLATQNHLNVCDGAYNWRQDKFAVGNSLNENDPKNITVSKTLPIKRNPPDEQYADVYYKLPYQAPLLPLTCSINVSYGEKNKLDEQAELRVSFIGGGASTAKLAPTSYFKPTTLLWDLASRRQASQQIDKSRIGETFTSYPDSKMNGCSFKSIPNISEQDCQKACSAESGCVGYSHSKLTSACELKNTLTARRRDPAWTSGFPSGTGPSQSSRQVKMNDVDIANGKRIQGHLIDATKATTDYSSRSTCPSSCMSDSTCVATEDDSNTCFRYSSVDGLKDAPQNAFITTSMKSQE